MTTTRRGRRATRESASGTTGTTSTTRQPRVAVIGSGLAGLTTAYLLRLQGVTVYLIEKSDRLGFHSSSIDIPAGSSSNAGPSEKTDSGSSWTVDVPMRSFQGGYYPNLIALYRHLGIPLQSTHYTFSFASLEVPNKSALSSSRPRSHFIHSGASGHSIPSLPTSSWASPVALVSGIAKLIAYAGCYLFLLALSFLSYHSLLPSLFSGTFGDLTLQISNFLAVPIRLPFGLHSYSYTPFGRIWISFTRAIVIPLFSSVGTMPEDEVFRTPTKHLLEYIHKTVGTDHFSPARGHSARTIANRLARVMEDQGEGYILLGKTVSGLKYEGGEVVVSFNGRNEEEGKAVEEQEVNVDRVVLATPASVALSLLGMLEESLTPRANNISSGAESEEEREMQRVKTMRSALKKVRYKETIVITHRDSDILPPDQLDIRDINLIHPSASPSSLSQSSTSFTTTKSRTRTRPTGTPHFDPVEGYTMATHVIVPPPSVSRNGSREAIYQTTNPCLPINPDLVLGTALLERALPLANPQTMITALHPPSPGIVYLAGSYAYPGIPLLEGCVGSAKRVVSALADDLHLDLEYDREHEHPHSRHARTDLGVDWTKGNGSLVGRVWRWRKREVYSGL